MERTKKEQEKLDYLDRLRTMTVFCPMINGSCKKNCESFIKAYITIHKSAVNGETKTFREPYCCCATLISDQ